MGISSFLVLIILLIISALAQKVTQAKRKRWIKAGIVAFVIALPAGLCYPWVLSRLTYSYPPSPEKEVAWRVNGWELTDNARQFIQENPGNYTPAELELNLDYVDIWTPDSLSKARMILLLNYTLLVLALATAIFCLLEANLKAETTGGAKLKSPNRKKKPAE